MRSLRSTPGLSARCRLLPVVLALQVLNAPGLASAASAPCAAPGAKALQAREDRARFAFAQEKRRVLHASGERHVELALASRKKGLAGPTIEELRRALEVSEGQHTQARQLDVLARRLGPDFFKKLREKPPASQLGAYGKKRAKLDDADVLDRFELGAFAAKKGLVTEAAAEFVLALRATEEALATDSRGRIVTRHGKIDSEVSRHLLEFAITIQGERRVREAWLEPLEDLRELQEARGAARHTARLWSTTSALERGELDALARAATALLGRLERDAGRGSVPPLCPLTIVFLDDDALFTRAAQGLGHPGLAGAASFHDRESLTALVRVPRARGESNEETSDDAALAKTRAERLRHLLLQLTHLHGLADSRAVLPTWYREGVAAAYGGSGAFAWTGDELVVGRDLDPRLLAELRETWMPLKALVDTEAKALAASSSGVLTSFTTEAWAFQRFALGPGGPELGERLTAWEAHCRDWALDARATRAAFDERFGADLAELGAEFQRWFFEWSASRIPE